jgi:ATP-binding cassette subfamily B protein
MNTPVEQVGQLLSMTLTAKTAVDRHVEVIDTVNDVADPAEPAEPARDADGRATGRGELTFCDVHFRHGGTGASGTGPGVLDGVDLHVRAGETMALVGLTGSGKTTAAMLVPRLYDVTAGSVRIDGVDVRDLTRRDLRTLVAVAFEDATLFSDTVRANVLLGAPPSARTDADLTRALAVAQAQFVHDLPDGLDTQIGEEGLALSGGQRQRLAVARAIAARPRVLVLDDPLSALDVSTEELVTQGLRREVEGTTTLVVAHRPSTVALADRVAVLQDGRITAVGTHSELIASHDHYRFVISSLAESEQMSQVQA